MKVGIIGFGSIGQRHYNNLLVHTRNVIVFSKRTDLDKISTVNSWKEFTAQGHYDAIFVTNETSKHLDTTKRCIALHPKAIFIEKPLSHSSTGLASLARILKKEKISTWVGYNMQFYQPLVAIKKLIDQKRLGRILFIRASVGQDLRGWRARDYRLGYSSKKQLGGGVMLDLVHDINYPSWLLGQKLYSTAGVSRKLSDLQLDTEDIAESILISKPGGIMVSVHQDYIRIPGRRSLEIMGTIGTVSWSSVDNKVFIESEKKLIEHKIKTNRNSMYQDEIQFFLRSIKSKKYFSNIDEAIHDVQVIEQLKRYAKK